MTTKPISRRTALRSIGQGAAIAAGVVAIPGSGLAAITNRLVISPTRPEGRIWQEHLGDFEATPIWLGELDGKLTVGWLDMFRRKWYGNYIQLTADLNDKPLRKVWDEIDHRETLIQMLRTNHGQTVDQKRSA